MNNTLQLPAPHVGATQEIWDAISVDLQQIVDDVSNWEGRLAERMCTHLEAAVKRLNDAVGHEREGYEAAIASSFEIDALRAQVETLTAYNATRTDELAASVAQCVALTAERDSALQAAKYERAEIIAELEGMKCNNATARSAIRACIETIKEMV